MELSGAGAGGVGIFGEEHGEVCGLDGEPGGDRIAEEFGIGVAIMLIANAYLLSREYFTMVAMRHMSARQAADLRRINAGRVWAAGLVPASLALVPFVSILVPLFSTSYFVHIFKRIAKDTRVQPAP